MSESTNWLTIYPTKDQKEKEVLRAFSESLGGNADTQQVVLAVDEALRTKQWRDRKLSTSELQLLQKVWNHLTQGIALGIDEAVNLKNRQVTERIKQKKAESMLLGVGFDFVSGDYRGNMAIGKFDPDPLSKSIEVDHPEYIPHTEIGDTVQFLTQRIEQLLALKTDKPVICIDIGAMHGKTWRELADVFATQIKAGRLVLIATNVSLTPDQISGLDSDSLVQFIATDVTGLQDLEISLPNQQTIKLSSGSVDILHESISISAHDKTLDVDARILTNLIGDTGLIMTSQIDLKRGDRVGLSHLADDAVGFVSGKGTVTQHSGARIRDEDASLAAYKFDTKDIHLDLLQKAIQTFEQAGLTDTNKAWNPETGEEYALRYKFWLAKNTPPLQLIDTQGNVLLQGEKPIPINNFRKLFQKVVNTFV